MQLMPATAAALAGASPRQTAKSDALLDPERNLTLGQRYVQHLLAQDQIHGNLLIALAAYNAGPAAALRWQRAGPRADDPLLFLESIPLAETRIYVERVLANYWIYQLRLGQPTPTLDAVAAGDWPVYSPQHPQSD
jgi:soluble lytic murein transglycosylase-like protein